MQTKIPKSLTIKATITLFTDDRKPWVKSSKLYLSTHVFHNYFPNTYTCIMYVKICHKNNLGLRCELGLLRVDVPRSLPRRFFKIGTQNTDIAIIKKVPFFFQKTVKLRPISRPARDATYAEKDTLLPRNFGRWWQHNDSSGTPGWQ